MGFWPFDQTTGGNMEILSVYNFLIFTGYNLFEYVRPPPVRFGYDV